MNQNINSKCVCHVPDWRKGNPYQELLGNAIESKGYVVDFENYPDSRLPLFSLLKSKPKIDIIHIHWISFYISKALWNTNIIKFYIRLAVIVLDLTLCRALGRRIVWTVHNIVGHESANPNREKIIRKYISKFVNHVIFHSVGAKNEFNKKISRVGRDKFSVISHGNYEGIYYSSDDIENDLKQRFDIKTDDKVFLFFGAIRGYKGIDTLLRAFRSTTERSCKLIIAGRVFDDDVYEQIQSSANSDSRIKAYLTFIPEREVAPLHSIAHAVVIPFERTLTSGSAILAISCGKALILPTSAKVLDVAGDNGVLFFENEKELSGMLTTVDKEVLKDMGANNKKESKKRNWSAIADEIVKVYIKI